MKKRMRLGEMLINAGLLTEDRLQYALREHKKAGLKLGEYLIRESMVKESQVIDLISRQMKIKKYKADDYPLDMDLARYLPADDAAKYKAVPIEAKHNLLRVAMVDPMDINALDAIEIMVNMEVEPVVCSEQDVNQLINGLYGVRSGMDGLMEDIGDLDVESEDGEPTGAGIGDVAVTSLEDMAAEAPVIRLVNSILSQAVREKVSDVHISPEKKYVQIRYRIDGVLQEIPSPPKSMHLPVVSRLKILGNMDIANTRIPQDGRFTINMDNKEINVRVSTLPTIYGENVVLRLLDMSAGGHTLDELGMIEADRAKVQQVLRKPYGMILSTGPTGSGKSTSLYAMLRMLNTPDINIITLEDPVEYRVPNIRQVQLNTKAGMTFASGLRSILRQDPDVVMVGEIRDHETANIAVQAALTGHRLLSTVHTNDAAGAITRFVDMGVEPFLISSVLLVSIAQRLVRRTCPYCQEEYSPEPALVRFWGLDDVKDARFVRGAGCYQCNNTGFKGRTGLYEILVNDEHVQEMILHRASSQEITRAMQKNGTLRTLKEDAALKVLQGTTTLEEATRAVMV
ncbi:GspE/PulE family protein [Desulfoplanes sp.]